MTIQISESVLIGWGRRMLNSQMPLIERLRSSIRTR